MKKRQLTGTILFVLLIGHLVAAQSPISNDGSGGRVHQQFDTRDWQTYKDKELGVEIHIPSKWKNERSEPARFKGDDGNVFMTATGAHDVEDVCRREANHKLQPFGTHPRVERLKVAGFEACAVWPSDNQIPSASSYPEAMVAIQYPRPIRIHDGFYWQLMMYGDVDHILAIAETIHFSSEATIAPPDLTKFVPEIGIDDDLYLDLDDDGIPEIAIRYTTVGLNKAQMETLKVLRYDAANGWAEAFQEEIRGVQPNYLNIWEVVTCADGRQGLLNTISMKGTLNVSTWYVLASVNGKIVKLEPPRERLETLKANGYEGWLAQVVFAKDCLLLEEFVKVKNPRLSWQPPNLVMKYRFTGSELEFISVERH